MGGSAKAASARRNAFEETSSVFAEASLFCACFLEEGRYLFILRFFPSAAKFFWTRS